MSAPDWAKLPDLPAESLLQILSYFDIPAPHPFWSQGITPQTLLPLRMNHDRKSKASHMQMAKRLAQVCRRVRPVYTAVIWANFECKTPVGLRSLQNACAEKNGVGSYIQELDLQLPALPADTLETQLAAIWPSLTSLHTITLTLTPAHGCPSWLAAQITSIPTLSTLRLRIMGNSLGPHLRAPATLKHLYIEVSPPEEHERRSQVLDENPGTPDPDAPSGPVSREAYHNWALLFNDVVDLVESAQSVTHMGWFVHWMLVHVFYRHMTPDPADKSNRRCIQVDKLPPNLTMLSVTLESQMGTDPFVRAMSGLPITDLAFTAYDHALLSGTAFKSFCESFKHLERLRLKLRSPSITVANEEVLPEAPHNEDAFCEGLASLKHLRCYKGPFLCKRPSTRSTFPARHLRLEVKSMLSEVTRRLSEKGVKPELLVQWSAWVDGSYGPKEYYVVPHEGPRRVDEPNALGE